MLAVDRLILRVPISWDCMLHYNWNKPPAEDFCCCAYNAGEEHWS